MNLGIEPDAPDRTRLRGEIEAVRLRLDELTRELNESRRAEEEFIVAEALERTRTHLLRLERELEGAVD